ncbi:MAG TPA: DNA-3-methyladenine glycosylase [Aestuariivirgaceae bacterium]|nr:DNA-3-methyladenine glycosylase [Aestuariivirgaceae bacterium]
MDTIDLAKYLIGKFIVRDFPEGRLSGRIVETEAYPVGDSSGHAFRGETKRNRSLFLPRGHAYVYLNYGLAYLLNIASEKSGAGAGVLVRAIEPIEGVTEMQRRRGTERILDLTRGPGRLTQAMGIDLRFDGLDLCSAEELWLGTARHLRGSIGQSTRIGISRETHQLRRFYEPGNPYVSGPKWLSSSIAREI